MQSERYILQDSFIQNSQYTGEVYYIYDTLLAETKGNYYQFKALAQSVVEDLNQEWKKELETTEWQRNSIFFCYNHYFYEETNNLSLHEMVELSKDKRNEIVKTFQNKRAKILFEIQVDIIDGVNCGTKLSEYNEILKKENILRNKLILDELTEIRSVKDFHTAILELQKWIRYLIENYNLYHSLFE